MLTVRQEFKLRVMGVKSEIQRDCVLRNKFLFRVFILLILIS
jgi:hypothetical protein